MSQRIKAYECKMCGVQIPVSRRGQAYQAARSRGIEHLQKVHPSIFIAHQHVKYQPRLLSRKYYGVGLTIHNPKAKGFVRNRGYAHEEYFIAIPREHEKQRLRA